MEFNQNKPIYLQIKEGDRILSVRELGGELGVNPNTAMRSYEKLTMDGIIFNQRGIGYFVAEGAKAIALDKMRTDFIENEVPLIKRKMELLQLKASDLGL